MKKNIDYVGMFKVASIVSLVLIVGTIVMFFTKGINYGVDFRGGVEVQVKFAEKVALGDLRTVMEENKVPAKAGGQVAKNARMELENKTGKKVVNDSNFFGDDQPRIKTIGTKK